MADLSARDLLPAAAQACGDVIARVPAAAWHHPSPCTGWSVRDVVNHLVAEHRWAPRLLRGDTLEQVGDAFDGDLLGDDPVGAWRAAIAPSLEAWRLADPDGRVHTSAGELPVEEYANQMLVDLTVHAWDVAAGAHVDVAYDPEAVDACLAYEEPRVADGGVDGLFAAPVETDSEHPLDRLVALLGRMAD